MIIFHHLAGFVPKLHMSKINTENIFNKSIYLCSIHKSIEIFVQLLLSTKHLSFSFYRPLESTILCLWVAYSLGQTEKTRTGSSIHKYELDPNHSIYIQSIVTPSFPSRSVDCCQLCIYIEEDKRPV